MDFFYHHIILTETEIHIALVTKRSQFALRPIHILGGVDIFFSATYEYKYCFGIELDGIL